LEKSVQIKSQKDFWSGVMFILAGVGFAWGATNYSFGSAARPGPGYFPFGLGILLAILGAVIALKALTVPTKDGDPVGAIARRPLALIVASVVVFGLVLPRLGMILSLPLLVLIASYAGDEFHLGEVLINSVVLTVASWAIFIWGLSLTIPLWPAFLGAR
jgi:Tripartite tricarboxylate transporter TctB family